MSKKRPAATLTADGVEGFFRRAREHARKLDRGETLAPEVTVSFENARDMVKLDGNEREILESVEGGDWRPTKAAKRDRARYTRYAKAPGKK